MSIAEPLPAGTYGKADWVDYTNYWREADAEWIQSRIILRYADVATRTTSLGASPAAGSVTYNDHSVDLGGGNWGDRIELYSRQFAKWVPLLMFGNLTSTKDDATGVALSHSLAGGKGMQLQPALTLFDNPVNIMGGVLTVDGTGVSVKTGARTVKLTTSATDLVSDSPITAAGFTTTGAFSAASLTVTGTLTAPTINASGTITGGVLNGTTATIGTVGIAAGIVTPPAGSGSANAAGIQSGQGYFYGDATSAVMRQRTNAASAAGAAFVQATATVLNLSATTVNMQGQTVVAANRSIQYATNAATSIQNGGPVIVQTTDPGVANVPEGTIWLNA